MLRLAILAALAALAQAQGSDPFNRPPADVDQALRARITEFFQYHVTGEYRKAEALVAEDTKDYFYDHNKPKYLSFEIRDIEYSDHFTRAKAVVICEQHMTIGLSAATFKVPTPSTWKLEDGKWFWWVDPKLRNLTPFGEMKGGAPVASGSAPTPPAMPSSADFLLRQVKIDKSALTVPPGKTGEAAITNTAPGSMKISVGRAPHGIAAKLSKSDLAAGETAKLVVTAAKDAAPGDLELQVYPTGQLLVIRISTR
ncbi:MAG: hypothetical protein KGN36_05260 [Acidobacteriota bacterium]|nr:hypothetical protein [Acidobacteriota bacterium]